MVVQRGVKGGGRKPVVFGSEISLLEVGITQIYHVLITGIDFVLEHRDRRLRWVRPSVPVE